MPCVVALAVLYLLDLEVVQQSDGAGEVAVPEVVGVSFDEARAKIEGVGLSARLVGKPVVDCPDPETGTPFSLGGKDAPTCRDKNPLIVSQTPEADAKVPRDATVTVDGGG